MAVYVLSGARPQRPDLDQFLDGESPAWYSPPLLARLRPGLPAPLPVVEYARPVERADNSAATSTGPVLFAYDGSPRAASAIEQAAAELSTPRDALVVCVWQPVDVGFTPVQTTHFDADKATEVRRAAEQTAAHGASLATRAGFDARSLAVEAAPIWKGIVETARRQNASLIVVGPHQRSGLLGHFEGSVAGAVVAHSTTPVLVIPESARSSCAEGGDSSNYPAVDAESAASR